jgi:AraC-like DNA-binding protein
MSEQSAGAARAADIDPCITVRSLADFAELRSNHLESSPYWWPEIGPIGNTDSFSLAHRMRRLGPITVLDVDFHNDVWVNGGEIRPHYHVTLPLATSPLATDSNSSFVVARGSGAVYRPEGNAGVPSYIGRLLAVMIDRYAVEDALADAIGRSVTSQIDVQPIMRTTTQVVRNWITMVSMFTEQLFRPRSIVHQPMVGMPFAESVVRGLLLATDHSYRGVLKGESTDPPPRAIRVAIDIIESEAHLPLTISTLASRSCVSVRSLQQGFQRHLGVSPMAYLRNVRLRRAHETLLESDPATATVSSVAYRWGFTNLGRFAAAHTIRYREPPAKTLLRSA